MPGIIKEAVSKNFLPHGYARVPLEGGVNLMMGPSGSAESTILLAISVFLDQTYTERGGKPSDPIGRSENSAEVLS